MTERRCRWCHELVDDAPFLVRWRKAMRCWATTRGYLPDHSPE